MEDQVSRSLRNLGGPNRDSVSMRSGHDQPAIGPDQGQLPTIFKVIQASFNRVLLSNLQLPAGVSTGQLRQCDQAVSVPGQHQLSAFRFEAQNRPALALVGNLVARSPHRNLAWTEISLAGTPPLWDPTCGSRV